MSGQRTKNIIPMPACCRAVIVWATLLILTSNPHNTEMKVRCCILKILCHRIHEGTEAHSVARKCVRSRTMIALVVAVVFLYLFIYLLIELSFPILTVFIRQVGK